MVSKIIEHYFEFFDKTDITDSFTKTSITSQTPLDEKVRIIEQNKGKTALIKNNGSQKEYIMGIIEPKDNTAFGLKIIKDKTEENKHYYLPVFYRDLSELIVSIN
jgi:hypothetical protein